MRLSVKFPRYLVLGIILLIGLMLRAEGLKWGIPKAPYWKAYHPDERVAFANLLVMTTSGGKLNPHYFVNPTFHYYLIGSVWWVAKTAKIVPSFKDIIDETPSVTLEDVTNIWLIARSISVALGVLTILLTYLLGLEIFKSETYAVAGAWLASVMPTLVVQSHYLTVDGPVGFWFLAALLLIIRAFRDNKFWLWMAAGLVSGLSVATKYNALLGIIFVFTVFLVRQKSSRAGQIAKARIKVAIFAGGLSAGFLLGCPYSVLSFGEWKNGINGLLYYNDFATDWLYPWLQTSRYSLGWPGWVLFLASLFSIFIKPDKWRTVLGAGIIPYFIIYGYKASPYMRHMVLIIPLMILLIIYALMKAGGYFWHRSFKLIVGGLIFLTSSYALANSLAWVKVMSGQDTREEAAEYIKQNIPLGSNIGLAGRYWFYTPPLEESEYNLIRLEYQPAILGNFYPPLVIISEYESKQYAFCRVAPEIRNDFFKMLKQHYRVNRVFKKVPQCCGIKFEGYPLADWNYFYPEITIYERSF
ncbi:glycosyltransferase family 39 protein [candidate division TA06 bacterium]|uniref:Glycosyltransferase family 39 protein n=1 Tax=candidate division TA06 bacterium TaxID=2250710 RepID=A0A933I976_UNCT6|nr:glycosyltransferase family 39 protein [candidate division TA06 bacterium]